MKSKPHRETTRARRTKAPARPRLQVGEPGRTRAPASKVQEPRSRLDRSAQDGLLVVDSKTGRIENVNPYLTKLLGYSRAEFVEKKLWEVGIFDDTKAGKNAFRSLQDNASFRYDDLPLRTKQGGCIRVQLVSSRSFEGGATLIKCNIRQSTTAKEKEHALIPGDEHFRSLFENMLNGYAHCRMIYEHGRPSDFVYLHVNQAFEALTGLKDVVGRRVTEVIPGIQNTNPEVFEAYARVASTGKAESLETYVEGLKTWFSVSAYSLKKGEFVAVFDNITARRGAQDALRESEEKYRGLVTEMGEGIFVTDDRGTVTFANPALARILALDDPHQVLGRNFMDFVAPSASKSVAGHFGKAIKTGRTSESLTVDIVRADGTNAVVEIRPRPIMVDGKVAGTRGVFRDITLRKRAEAELQAAKTELERFDTNTLPSHITR